jgi:hypothetical protein
MGRAGGGGSSGLNCRNSAKSAAQRQYTHVTEEEGPKSCTQWSANNRRAAYSDWCNIRIAMLGRHADSA